MKILYGVCGEGFGHSSRALVVGEYLEGKGHKVIFVTYGQGYKVLKNKFKVFKVKGLHMIFEKSVLKKRRTVLFNLRNFSKNFLSWKKFYKLMDDFNPDLCISDMEPIVPVLSNIYDIPLVSLDNQHRLTNLKLNIPSKYKQDYFLAKEVVNAFVRRAEYFIVTSFAKAPVNDKRTLIVPPIIRGDVRRVGARAKYGEKILVYLTKKDRRVLSVLKKIPESFVVYGYNVNKVKGNLEFKTRESFLSDLKDCKAIIATAGFTLMGEAIYLKKPYLALPLRGQFEQVLNALFLKKVGFGDYSESLTEKEVLDFLSSLGKYRKKLKGYNPDYNRLFKVLDKTIKEGLTRKRK